MRRPLLRILALSSVAAVGFILSSGPAFAQNCVSSAATGIYASTLTLHGSDPALPGAVQAASTVWSSCSSTGLPSISLGSGGSLDYSVTITEVSSGPICGVTDTGSHTIAVARNYTYQGRQYPCNIDVTLEHEIGHVFGLADSPCGSGYLMGQQALGTTDARTLQPAECAAADRNVTTPHEQVGGLGTPCSPQSLSSEDDTESFLPCGSPLILDMNGDGFHTTSLARPVRFDFLGSGDPIETSWTDPSTEEAFLVLDLNGNGRIDSGRELFGTDTILPSGEKASNGFEALAVYDSPRYGGDGDGQITPRDRIWYSLELWIDRKHNGISTPRELIPLWSSGVQSIDLRFVETQNVDANGNWHRFVGSFSRRCRREESSCKRTGILEDVFFLFAR